MEVEEKNSLPKLIVLKELIAEKNPKLAQRIPFFAYWFLNRLLHIKEVNEIISKYGNLSGYEFVAAILKFNRVKCNYLGVEHLSKNGKYIFVSNHPLGGFDGLMLINGIYRFVGPTFSLVRDELTKIPQLKELFVPINKFGGQRQSAQSIHDAYESDRQIVLFPSGLASRKVKGKIIDLKWQKHFVQKSVEHQRDVIPVYINGRNSRFFYWLSSFREKIGIKMNIEMFLLADELFRQKGRTFTITFGKPIKWQSFDNSKSAIEWAEEVKNMVYTIGR